MRVMAIDYGDVRTGIAVSDLTNTFTGQAWTVEEKNSTRLVLKIAAEVKERDVGQIVLGNPKNMDGSEGARSEKSRELKALLEECVEVPVALWDERRTTISAHDILHASGKPEKQHRKVVDAVAASLILEAFLDKQANLRRDNS